MKKAGFKTINLSFVSTDFSVKERMKRPGLSIDFKEIVDKAEQVGLNVIAYAILGMPGQSTKEMVDTLIYLMGKRVLIGPSIYYPTPGTPLFERCKKEGILPFHPSRWRSSALPIETMDFNRLDIIALFRLARVINFIKGKMDKKELDEGMTLKELYQVLREKAKVEAEVEGPHPDTSFTWIDLLLLFLKERSFFSLRKDHEGNISVLKEKSSKRVLDYFFEKTQEIPILKCNWGRVHINR
jgi:radical SAM superfamily enzyme YgiQ (UPF0313 family)